MFLIAITSIKKIGQGGELMTDEFRESTRAKNGDIEDIAIKLGRLSLDLETGRSVRLIMLYFYEL